AEVDRLLEAAPLGTAADDHAVASGRERNGVVPARALRRVAVARGERRGDARGDHVGEVAEAAVGRRGQVAHDDDARGDRMARSVVYPVGELRGVGEGEARG